MPDDIPGVSYLPGRKGWTDTNVMPQKLGEEGSLTNYQMAGYLFAFWTTAVVKIIPMSSKRL